MDNLYERMGIDKGADSEAIKKAYRQLALKHHPDRNPGDKEAENKFKKIQEAYDILSDPHKKLSYDRSFFATPVQSVQDLFDTFFTQRPRQNGWGNHIEMELVIDFIESVKGCKRVVNLEKRRTCKSCNGTSALNGKEFKDCVLCDGTGKVVYQHTSGSVFRMETVCQSCKGTGKVVLSICLDCSGKGYDLVPCCLELRIPAGINSGMKICARGEGDVGLMGSGNLYCLIKVKSHPVFQREGINLLVKMPITYSQAVLGGEVQTPCIGGSHKFKLPAGTKSGSVFRIAGLGLVLRDGDDVSKGDLLVKVIVDVPDADNLSPKYRDLLSQLVDFEKENPGESSINFKKNLEGCNL